MVAVSLCAFPYYGGKTAYSEEIVGRIPRHRRYVEVFGGGASVLLNKPKSGIEVYNDHDEHVVRFFRVLRQRRDELVEWLDAALYARADHERWARQFYGDDPLDTDDVVALAGRWFTLRHTQYGSITKGVSGFSTPYKRNEAQGMRENIRRLNTVQERFQNVVVECDDWREILDRYDGRDSFLYLDPPYVGNEHEYVGGELDHATLVDALADLDADWMVSYRNLPDGLEDVAETIEQFGAVDRADGVKEATEQLVMSYDPHETPLFSGAEQRTLCEVGTDTDREGDNEQ